MLAAVSRRYPEPQGRFPRVTHPCATHPRRGAYDLHVLSAPPAFVLSQDQTLSFILSQAPDPKAQDQTVARASTRKANTHILPLTGEDDRAPTSTQMHRQPTRHPHIPSQTNNDVKEQGRDGNT